MPQPDVTVHSCVHDWMGRTIIDAPKILIRPAQILRVHLLPSPLTLHSPIIHFGSLYLTLLTVCAGVSVKAARFFFGAKTGTRREDLTSNTGVGSLQ
jgi:hypothetical protein